MHSRVSRDTLGRINYFSRGGAMLLLIMCCIESPSAQSIIRANLELKCENPSRYPGISFDSEATSACTSVRDKSDKLVEALQLASPATSADSWRSWLQSPQCKEEAFKAIEGAAAELEQVTNTAFSRAKDKLNSARQLAKIAQEMKSTHNAEQASAILLQSNAYADMVEDTFSLIPQVYVTYGDRALAAKCYRQADKAYRFVVERYSDEKLLALRERAKIGIDDVRAKTK